MDTDEAANESETHEEAHYDNPFDFVTATLHTSRYPDCTTATVPDETGAEYRTSPYRTLELLQDLLRSEDAFWATLELDIDKATADRIENQPRCVNTIRNSAFHSPRVSVRFIHPTRGTVAYYSNSYERWHHNVRDIMMQIDVDSIKDAA